MLIGSSWWREEPVFILFLSLVFLMQMCTIFWFGQFSRGQEQHWWIGLNTYENDGRFRWVSLLCWCFCLERRCQLKCGGLPMCHLPSPGGLTVPSWTLSHGHQASHGLSARTGSVCTWQLPEVSRGWAHTCLIFWAAAHFIVKYS